MAKKCKCEEKPAGSPAWMTTYGDMVTQLLVFFVAMLAMSNISPGKFQQVAVGIQLALTGQPPSVLLGGRSIQEEPLITQNPGVRREILRVMQDERYKGKITVQVEDRGTRIILQNLVFFEEGSAILTKEAKELLSVIGSIVIEHTTNVLEIYGYTDDRPLPSTSIYPSNWHLGAARAASVARFFAEELKQRRSIERLAEVKLGTFDPEYFYNPDRFYPIGVGDREILKKISALNAEIEASKNLLKRKLENGEITSQEFEQEIQKLDAQREERLKELRDSFRRIDILIVNERVR
ncbi:MAG: chemotaxis protein MotB [Thermotogota bacterium]|nr:chemotaxis protein MotB [Thermotogota bacterium]MDK2864299.1 chemotaxis protein MotB [Thermotogota bacterium]HCZ05569.1 flagellar motor protein MotB [Thermotogota bacterium]